MQFTLDITKVLLIFIILSLLGLNIFNYFARATDTGALFTKKAAGVALQGAERTVDLSKKGTKATTDVVAGALEGGLKTLERALDIQVDRRTGNGMAPQPDQSGSDIQMPKKTGFCYVGEEKGIRTCVYVGKRDTCLSGDVYPSMAVCVNPALRA